MPATGEPGEHAEATAELQLGAKVCIENKEDSVDSFPWFRDDPWVHRAWFRALLNEQ